MGVMRALVVSGLSNDFSGCALSHVPVPEPGPGEVRVRVRAAAINFPDILQTRGEYQYKPTLPFIPGIETAGEVDAVGAGVESFASGDAVVSHARVGGYAEFVVLPASDLRPKPARLSFSEAAGYGVAYLTAYVALVRRAQLQPGEWVLVHGAAGGTGLACLDLARHLGARVIAASPSAAKLEIIARDYAPDAIVNTSGGFLERVRAITGGRGADVIFDPVGGDVFDESTRCIAFDGRILVVGFTSGRIPTIPVNIPLIKGFSVMGLRAGEYARRFPERGAENQTAIWALAEAGHVRPRVDCELPLAQWRDGFARLLDRKTVGKTILRPDL
jgi:NADPH:quinone reductase